MSKYLFGLSRFLGSELHLSGRSCGQELGTSIPRVSRLHTLGKGKDLSLGASSNSSVDVGDMGWGDINLVRLLEESN